MKGFITLLFIATLTIFTFSCSDSSGPSKSHPLNGTWLVDSYTEYDGDWELDFSNIETKFEISGSKITVTMTVMGFPYSDISNNFKSDGDNFEWVTSDGTSNKGKMIGNDKFEIITEEEDWPRGKVIGERK